jgi:prephenate dehydrogenase
MNCKLSGVLDRRKKPKIGIIGGRGKLGRIFKKFFRDNSCSVLISGRKTKLTNIELVKKCDVVIFSVPIDKTLKVIKEVIPYTRKEQLLMDFTSIKEKSVKEMLKSKANVIALHPMFGSVLSLKGQTMIVIPARTNKEWLKWLLEVFEKNRIRIKITSVKEHDRIMAILQGLSHFNFIALAHALTKLSKKRGNIKDIDELLSYGGTVYRLRLSVIARILAQNPDLYADIALLNPEIKDSISTYVKETKKLARVIYKKDKKSFIRYFNEAANFFGNFKEEAFKETDLLVAQLAKLKVSDSKRKKWQKK